ncbi:hypothetical protein [Streptomyces sp. NPDC058155]|uniref:hypothetical protein n=1 Tax=Streptomyces sp. NPDC058155 TaxID=3346359 RepID=UPI0036EF6CCE
MRLWIVEPLGETGNWGYPYWLLSQQIRVVEETEAWRAFGHRGAQVLTVIAQLPDLARQWAAQWGRQPRGRPPHVRRVGEAPDAHPRAGPWAHYRAEYSRRAAGLKTAGQLADNAATQAATDAGTVPSDGTTTSLQLPSR